MAQNISGKETNAEESTGLPNKEVTILKSGTKTFLHVAALLVDASGNVIKATQQEENRAGSDCSGTDGTTGRVLTLVNTSESGAPVAVWVEDQIIAQTDITVSHLSASSTITFDNIEIFDAVTIRVNYYV